MAARTMKKTPSAKKIGRRAWTKTDIKALRTMARQKTPVPQIAKSLSRSAGAVRQKGLSEGISLNSR